MLHTQLNSLSRTGSVDMLREQIGSMEFEKQQMQKRAQEEHESFTTAIKGLRDQIVILQSEKNNNQFGTKEELVRLQNITNVQIDQNKQLQMENQLLKMRITEI